MITILANATGRVFAVKHYHWVLKLGSKSIMRNKISSQSQRISPQDIYLFTKGEIVSSQWEDLADTTLTS